MAAKTQALALNALVFLYKTVLQQPLALDITFRRSQRLRWMSCSAPKNRTLIYLSQPNRMTQRTAADVGMVLGFIWNKEGQGADADV